jgi:2-C-methyl-D-erythritol 4-phosphate cytidylyltransferase
MAITPTPAKNIVAILPAAGTGTRMGDNLPKQYLPINGEPMIVHTIRGLLPVARIRRVVVVIAPHDPHWHALAARYQRDFGNRVVAVDVGGATRAASVLNGMRAAVAADPACNWALVHDAARPCIRTELVEQFLDELTDDPVGGLLALPVADTLKRGDDDLRVACTVERAGLWRAQTPQMFGIDMLTRALAAMPEATDEAAAIEALGQRPRLVIGESANLKVTYATDMTLARILLTEMAMADRPPHLPDQEHA